MRVLTGTSAQQRKMKTEATRREVPGLDEAAKGMEKIFIKFLMDEIRKGEAKTDIFGARKKNDFFEGELYNEYARLMAERGDFGLASMIKSQVKKTLLDGGRK